ncbi:hypothetical protein Micbo1qcDRAFT_169964 [Microdochium bolleyi]|uniref:Uncharacterized protein n=1 Tax=Microdochium bolleyi TaxID=196109 RepID=A0A136IIG8_9PEZI|nr:hypothetical protein Micbo1qcDRAFT_169964 [Microdochium bolleyi]
MPKLKDDYGILRSVLFDLPRRGDILHHIRWMALCVSLHYSDMSGELVTLIVRAISTCTLFSLGISSVVLLFVVFFMATHPPGDGLITIVADQRRVANYMAKAVTNGALIKGNGPTHTVIDAVSTQRRRAI